MMVGKHYLSRMQFLYLNYLTIVIQVLKTILHLKIEITQVRIFWENFILDMSPNKMENKNIASIKESSILMKSKTSNQSKTSKKPYIKARKRK